MSASQSTTPERRSDFANPIDFADVAVAAEHAPKGTVGLYKLGEMIARGGMGVVFEAKHRELGRSVALKIVRGANLANSHELGRFKAETEAVAKLDHPNIIPIYDVGEMYGQPYFTMKLIEGGSLGDRLKKGPLPVREAAQMMVKVARAVQHAHERGVLHRDLKPGNILLDAHCEPFLTDFGLAKFAGVDLTLTMPGEVIGTPEYMAPEQTRGDDLTMSCDVWALGVVLFQTITGRMPFVGTTALEIVEKIGNEEPSSIYGVPNPATGPSTSSIKSGIDRDIATIVGRCLEKDCARRMASAGFLADELERWLERKPIRSRHVTPSERVFKWMRRHPGTMAASLLILISILVGSISSFVLWQKADSTNFALNSTNDRLFAVITKLNSTNDKMEQSNSDLARSLRHATATRLASESREQVNLAASLGLALAVESAELSMRAGEQPLPEAVGALMNAVSLVGGVDFSAKRGLADQDARYAFLNHVFLNSRSMGSRPVSSPDGKWFATVNFLPDGMHYAVFHDGLPLNGTPVRTFVVNHDGPRPAMFSISWTPDSRELLTTDHMTLELRAWDVFSGEDRTSEPPRFRVIHKFERLEGGIHFTNRNKGNPTGLLNGVSISNKANMLLWQPLDPVRGLFGALGDDTFRLPAAIEIQPPEYQRQRRFSFIDSPSGRWILNYDTYSAGAPVLIELPASGATPKVRMLDKTRDVLQDAAFSPDNRWLVYSGEHEVVLHDLREEFTGDAIAHGRIIGPGSRLSFSPDGKWLAVSVGGGIVELTPFDETGPRIEERIRYRFEGKHSREVAFSPVGDWFALACGDGIVRANSVSRIRAALPPVEYRGLASEVLRLLFSRDGKILTATDLRGEVRRWEFNGLSSGARPLIRPPAPAACRTLAVSPDGRWLVSTGNATATQDEPVYFHDMINGGVREVGSHNGARTAVFSACGRWFGTSGLDGAVRWWDWPALAASLEAGGPLAEHTQLTYGIYADPASHNMAFHPSGRIYAAIGGGEFLNINTLAKKSRTTNFLFHSNNYMLPGITVSPDGKWAALVRHGHDTTPREGSTQYGNLILLLDCSDPAKPFIKHELRNSFSYIGKVCFSADSRWLASSGGSTSMPTRVWDMSAPDIAASAVDSPFTGHTVGLAFSPAESEIGTLLATGDTEGVIHLWDWRKGPSEVRRIETREPISSAAFLPDGRLVTAGRDRSLRTWELSPKRLIELARQVGGRGLTDAEKTRFRAK